MNKIEALLFFQQAGQGSPLLLLHGLEVNGTMFDPIVPTFTPHYQMIVPDLRGHGRSQDLPGPYDVPQLTADVIGLLDTLALSVVDVLGYSHGGAVAQYLAYMFPHRVRRLILACTYACNALSFRENIEDRLRPWLIRILGSRRLIHFAICIGALGPLDAEQAHRLLAMVPSTGTRRMIARTRSLTTFDSRSWLAQNSATDLDHRWRQRPCGSVRSRADVGPRHSRCSVRDPCQCRACVHLDPYGPVHCSRERISRNASMTNREANGFPYKCRSVASVGFALAEATKKLRGMVQDRF